MNTIRLIWLNSLGLLGCAITIRSFPNSVWLIFGLIALCIFSAWRWFYWSNNINLSPKNISGFNIAVIGIVLSDFPLIYLLYLGAVGVSASRFPNYLIIIIVIGMLMLAISLLTDHWHIGDRDSSK